jgi:hypothetical protein
LRQLKSALYQTLSVERNFSFACDLNTEIQRLYEQMGVGSISHIYLERGTNFDKAERNFTAAPSASHDNPLEVCIFKVLEAEERKYDFAGAIRLQKELEN